MRGFTTRPVIMGTNALVSAGHYLGTLAGIRTLERGGNAIDAAAATGLALAVLEPTQNSLGGEAPMLIYAAKEHRIVALSGQGPAALSSKIEWFASKGIKLIPGDGFLSAVVPSVVGTWIEALEQFGTMSFREVVSPAIQLAEDGFPIQSILGEIVSQYSARFQTEWHSTAKIFLPNGGIPEEGQVLRQLDLATTLRTLVEAERKAPQGDRISGLEAARKEFYEGRIAKKMLEFIDENGSLDATGQIHKSFLSAEDFVRYRASVEAPVHTQYKDYELFKCGPWSQGPMFLQRLNILEGFDLPSLGQNTADYIHLLIEVAKLTLADREKYYGDPDFDEVPMETLLSKKYAAERRGRIDFEQVAFDYPEGTAEMASGPPTVKGSGDTTHLDVIDKHGNMVSATPSGGWIMSSPVIEGLGFALNTRAQAFYLDPKRNNALAPGKRPRTTLSPSLAFKNEKPYMVFGSPGADQQDDFALQFFLNFVEFGMNIQEAIDAPSFFTLHFPSSFYPREAEPRKVVVEGRIRDEVVKQLSERGHIVEKTGDWANGRVCAVLRDPESGVLMGGASPKMNQGNTGYALGW